MSKTFGMIGGGGGGIKLASISITTPPSKTTYTAGETFDPAGMVVEATYSNGATLKCTGYSYEPNTPLTDGTTKVTIRYTEGGVTATAEQAITVSKAAGSLSISPTSLTLGKTNPAGEIIVDRAGDGSISAVSSAPDIAEVSVSGNIVTVTGKASGNATITISVAEGTNHTAPASKTCAVTVQFIPTVGTPLNDCTWEQISEISSAGQGANYWSIGDRKAETLNGTVGSLALNGTYYAFIVDFDHNMNKESPNAHTITFQFAKSALTGGTDIAFVDGSYNSNGSSAAFRMNTTKTNSGGWTGSYMKKTIMPAFKSACSAALQAVIKPVTIYSDNVGGGSNTASDVKASSEEFYLPAEFEVQGKRTYANSAEQNYQTQLAYYKAGNSKVKYKHNATGTAAFVWCRSAIGDSERFCLVRTQGSAGNDYAYCSLGVAPLCNV